MKELWNYFIRLMKDQRGEVGDLDTKDDDDTPDADAVVEDKDDDEEEENPFAIKIGDDEEEDEKEKAKAKKKADEPDEKDKRITDLEKEVEKAKKAKSKAFYDLRQAKKEGPESKAGQLSKAQIRQILADNKDDPDTLMNVVEYIAEQTAHGISSETVNAAEINRKKGELDGLLVDRYPDINEPGSDIRTEVDEAKKILGLDNHPYGDYFAVASRVLEDLPELLKDAYNKGKGETGETAEDKRKKDIKSKQLPASKKAKAPGGELTGTQEETAKQMNMTPSQRKIYAKLAGNKARSVSVEE